MISRRGSPRPANNNRVGVIAAKLNDRRTTPVGEMINHSGVTGTTSLAGLRATRGLLLSYCWCQRKLVTIPMQMVRDGLTVACKHPDCKPPS